MVHVIKTVTFKTKITAKGPSTCWARISVRPKEELLLTSRLILQVLLKRAEKVMHAFSQGKTTQFLNKGPDGTLTLPQKKNMTSFEGKVPASSTCHQNCLITFVSIPRTRNRTSGQMTTIQNIICGSFGPAVSHNGHNGTAGLAGLQDRATFVIWRPRITF